MIAVQPMLHEEVKQNREEKLDVWLGRGLVRGVAMTKVC